MKLFGQDAFSTMYECTISERFTDRIIEAPEMFATLEEVGIFIKRHYSEALVDYLVQTIEAFDDGSTVEFGHSMGIKALSVKYNYI